MKKILVLLILLTSSNLFASTLERDDDNHFQSRANVNIPPNSSNIASDVSPDDNLCAKGNVVKTSEECVQTASFIYRVGKWFRIW